MLGKHNGMNPKIIARLLSEDISINNGFILEEATGKITYICPKCPICGQTAVIEIEKKFIDAIQDLMFDEIQHELDADTVMLIRSGVHPNCFRSKGYVPTSMAVERPIEGDQWRIGDLASFGSYFDSKDRPEPPINEEDR